MEQNQTKVTQAYHEKEEWGECAHVQKPKNAHECLGWMMSEKIGIAEKMCVVCVPLPPNSCALLHATIIRFFFHLNSRSPISLNQPQQVSKCSIIKMSAHSPFMFHTHALICAGTIFPSCLGFQQPIIANQISISKRGDFWSWILCKEGFCDIGFWLRSWWM